MVVRVERVVDVSASPEQVWEFIADPEQRARAITVVREFETLEDGRAVWHLTLPIPLVDRTVRVETEERTRERPRYVEFVGDSKVLHVVGEHELEAHDGGTRLSNRFVVDGKLPGVERFFKHNMEKEFDNLERALQEYLELTH